jgi:hypothetical protein
MMGGRSDLGLCPMVGFGITGVKCSSSTVRMCVKLLMFTSSHAQWIKQWCECLGQLKVVPSPNKYQ